MSDPAKNEKIEKRTFTCLFCGYSAQVYGEMYFDYGCREFMSTFRCRECRILFENIITKMECRMPYHVEYDLADEIICLYCGTDKNNVWNKATGVCPKCEGKMTFSGEGNILLKPVSDYKNNPESTQKREIIYLAAHSEWFKKHICGNYPLSEEFIHQNIDLIDWKYLSLNERLPWSSELIDRYTDRWDWEELSINEFLPWSDDLIIRFSDKWNWPREEGEQGYCLTDNWAIEWTKKIIYMFPDKFSGTMLATETELLNRHPEILWDFRNKLWWDYISGDEYLNWSEELIDRFDGYWNWEILSANRSIKWHQGLKDKYTGKFSEYYYKYGYAEMFINRRIDHTYFKDKENINMSPYSGEELKLVMGSRSFDMLSSDERIPWTEEFIARYENSWDWESLSRNISLPWSERLIDRFLERWDFGGEKTMKGGEKYLSTGLSYNKGLPWSIDLIRKYELRWDWRNLAYSEDIPWSIELLEAFDERWLWKDLIWNRYMWEKVFYPVLDDKDIAYLLELCK